MKIVKVKILKGYIRETEPKFVFRKGQIWEMIMTNRQAKDAKKGDGNMYRIISTKDVAK